MASSLDQQTSVDGNPARPTVAETLFELYPKLVRSMTRQFRDLGLAEDAVLEAFLKAVRSEDILRDHPQPAGWLWRTAYNQCISTIRSRQLEAKFVRNVRVLGVHGTHQESPETEAISKTMRRELYERIVSLPNETDRETFLAHLQGDSPQAAAAQLGITYLAFKSRLQRARQALKAEIRRRQGPPNDRASRR